MGRQQNLRGIRLPNGWPRHVTSAMLHVIALAQYAMAYTRSWAANSPIARQRLQAENDQLKQLVALLTEEIRIKDARMKRIAAQRRPQYALCLPEITSGRKTAFSGVSAGLRI